MNNARDTWAKMVTILETESSAISFDVWIKTLEPVDIKDNILILQAVSDSHKEFVNNKFKTLIKTTMQSVNGLIADVTIIAPEERESCDQAEETHKVSDEPARIESIQLNPKYSFENFVVGSSNQLVNAAARAVAESPGSRFNPLFIYGGVGLGKTHIMHAIGNALRQNHPHLKTLYVSSEKFTNEVIDFIRAGKSYSFREKYRNTDVLIIDDIQFIAGKEMTQAEFFHTFNDLYQANKQIVISSDRPPKEISELEERLKSRFEWGMIADIQPPDLETRIAILEKKAQIEKHNIPREVLTFMAQRIDKNIRELEGLLNKVIFLSMLACREPNIDLVKEALKDYEERNEEALTADDIINAACKYFNVTREEMVGKKKNKEIVEPRQMTIYLITEMLTLPLASIGNMFGGRDHTTVMHARNKISEKIKTNPRTRVVAQDIKDMIK